MIEVEVLFDLWKKNGTLTDSQIKDLYFLSPKVYDYENHKYNSKIATILNTRNIKADLANILECMEDEIATPEDKMDINHLYLYDGLHIINLFTHEVVNGKRADVTKYKKYVPKEEDKKEENLLEKLKKKSILPGYAKRPYSYSKKEVNKDEIKEKIAVAITTVVFAATAVATSTYGVIYDELNKDVKQFLDDNRHIVTDEMRRTDDLQHYYYLHSKIAKNVLNSDKDTEALIYVVYDNLSKDAATINGHNERQIDYNMDLFMQSMNMYSERYNYNSFNEYLASKGFVKEDGTADTAKYDTEMRKYIDEILKNNEMNFDGGKTY